MANTVFRGSDRPRARAEFVPGASDPEQRQHVECIVHVGSGSRTGGHRRRWRRQHRQFRRDGKHGRDRKHGHYRQYRKHGHSRKHGQPKPVRSAACCLRESRISSRRRPSHRNSATVLEIRGRSDQVNLTYQIFNIRMLLERSLSDRLLPNDRGPRRQAVLGFNVQASIRPMLERDAAAIVEITVDGGGEVELVGLMPQEKTYEFRRAQHTLERVRRDGDGQTLHRQYGFSNARVRFSICSAITTRFRFSAYAAPGPAHFSSAGSSGRCWAAGPSLRECGRCSAIVSLPASDTPEDREVSSPESACQDFTGSTTIMELSPRITGVLFLKTLEVAGSPNNWGIAMRHESSAGTTRTFPCARLAGYENDLGARVEYGSWLPDRRCKRHASHQRRKFSSQGRSVRIGPATFTEGNGLTIQSDQTADDSQYVTRRLRRRGRPS